MDAKRAAFIAHLRAKPPTTFYEMAGIERTADEEELKKAYRKLVLLLHPDKGGDTELFKRMGALYELALKAAEEPAKKSTPPPPPPPKKEGVKDYYYEFVWEDIKDFDEVEIKGTTYGVNVKGDVINRDGEYMGHYTKATKEFTPVGSQSWVKEPPYWPHLLTKVPPSNFHFQTRAEHEAWKAKKKAEKEKADARKEKKKADKEADKATKKLVKKLNALYEIFINLYQEASDENQEVMKATEKAWGKMMNHYAGVEED